MHYATTTGKKAIRGVPIATIARELNKLHKSDDEKLRARAFVEAAKPEGSPLHALFEWDNRKAGERYRIWQARHYIRLIVIQREPETPPQQAWQKVTLRTAEGRADQFYQRSEILTTKPQQYASALQIYTIKFRAAADALEDVKRLATESEGKERLDLLAAITEGFTALRMLTDKLQ